VTAGARRHHCALQNRTATVDEIGQPSTEWVTVRMFYAHIKYLTGLSAIKSGADTSITKVSIRALHGAFDAGQRVVCDGVVFDIQSVLPDGKRKEVDLVCVVVSG
jgi:SPP1 family predicted phage head-tail adaptor